jgi:hypothetical protein
MRAFPFGPEVILWPWALPHFLNGDGGKPTIIVREDRACTDPRPLALSEGEPLGRPIGPIIVLDDGLLLWFPDLATFRVEQDGALVTFQATTDRETLQHLLLDQVLPRVLAHRGHHVLHAAAVDVARGAIGFVGETGRGKSTLTGAFEAAGFASLSDDGLVLEHGPDVIQAVPTYPSLRLWPDSVSGVFRSAPDLAPMAHYSDKRRVARPSWPAGARSRPLLSLYFLGDPADAVEVRRVSPREATVTLIENSFQLETSDRRRAAAVLDSSVEIASSVPAFELAYPRDYSRLDEVREAILEHASTEVCGAARQ